LAEAEVPLTSEELATKTGTVERLVREWLANQVTSGLCYLSFKIKKIHPEQKLALDENSPVYRLGAFKLH
jgi:hypothetical protein